MATSWRFCAACRLASPCRSTRRLVRNTILKQRRDAHGAQFTRQVAILPTVASRSSVWSAAVAGAWNERWAPSVAAAPVALARHCSMFSTSDTVFALSSGQGKCGVSVIRASGPHALQALLKIARLKSAPKSRYALLRKLSDPQSGDTIDHGLILWFPAPDSFTGEDSVEFQTHGGPSVVLALLTALAKIPGCRHAEPGDFTKRAFFNNKLDLTGVEGLADLIHAETEAQRKQALRQMEGDLGRLYEQWRKALLRCVAHVEATIDFGEDENIEEGLVDQVRDKVAVLLSGITDHLNDGRRGERLRSGVHVAIVGAPNAGKSSLLNIMCQRPAAIVSAFAGTTRDVLESALDIFGYPIVLSDTAGLRVAHDPVEQEGVRRALQRAQTADLKILIADCSLHTELLQTLSDSSLIISDLARRLLELNSTENGETWMAKALEAFTSEDTIVVLNKTDLLPPGFEENSFSSRIEGVPTCWISCKNNTGIVSFMETLKRHLEQLCGNPLAGNPSLTQARHRQHLGNCSTCLDNFLGLGTGEDFHLDIAAEELRAAIRQLGRITGRVGVEEILDVVFKDFCIGK